MKQQEYPQKIYVCYDEVIRELYASDFKNPEYQVEYTRSDLIPKWHKYPDERPPQSDRDCGERYQVTLKIQYPFEDKPKYKVVDKIYFSHINKWFITESEEVIAWQELPKPYKED